MYSFYNKKINVIWNKEMHHQKAWEKTHQNIEWLSLHRTGICF